MKFYSYFILDFSVVLENAKTNLLPIESSSRTHSTALETAGKNAVVPESSTSVKNSDNETESVRPKRGRSTKRYTEYVFLFNILYTIFHLYLKYFSRGKN